jgi:hypothetical protein
MTTGKGTDLKLLGVALVAWLCRTQRPSHQAMAVGQPHGDQRYNSFRTIHFGLLLRICKDFSSANSFAALMTSGQSSL